MDAGKDGAWDGGARGHPAMDAGWDDKTEGNANEQRREFVHDV